MADKHMAICLPCANPKGQCNGDCPCPSDGQSIFKHAAEQKCPLNKFDNVTVLATVRNVAQALISKRVSLEIFEERTTICESCDYVKTRNGSKYCGQCGCSVLKESKQILNLAHVEENLPRWGCKHPERAQGKGWQR